MRYLLLLVPLVITNAACGKGDPAEEAASAAQSFLRRYALADITFYQVDPASEGHSSTPNKALHGWTILLEKSITDRREIQEVLRTLGDPTTYSGMGAKCFEPGLGLRFKEAKGEGDLVICLKCFWIYYYEEGRLVDTWGLSQAGVDRLMAFYLAQVGPKK